jgi:hypothetical protein
MDIAVTESELKTSRTPFSQEERRRAGLLLSQSRVDIRSVCTAFRLSVGIVCLLLAGCSTSDKYPMRNRETGKVVYCTTGPYTIQPSEHNMDIADYCVRKCASKGFDWTNGPNSLVIGPLNPRLNEEEAKRLTPTECR